MTEERLQHIAAELDTIRMQLQALKTQIPEGLAARVAQMETRLERAEADLVTYAARVELREARFVPMDRYLPVERVLFWLIGTVSALVIAYWVTLLLRGGKPI